MSSQWLILMGLGPALACGDDLPDALGGSSGAASTSTTGEPATSTSSGPVADDTGTSTSTSTGTSEGETTLGASATEPGTDTSDGGDATTTSGTSGTSGTTSEATAGTTTEGTGSTGPVEPIVEPTAVDDVACMVRLQEAVLVDPLVNDSDPQGSPVELVGYTTGSIEGGTVTQVGDLLAYTPPPGFWGEDLFRYTIADPEGHETIGEVRVMVWPGTIPASELALGQHGFSISPDVQFGRLGWSLAGGGDLDGDGIDDLVVAAPFASNGMGRIYVVFGRPDPAPVQLAAVAAGEGGYVLQGDFPGEYAGWSVAGLGDLDGDGIDDLAVGAGWANAAGTRAGRVYVVFSQAFGGTVSLAGTPGTDGFAIDGASPEDWAGWSVSGTGDMNGDGVPEVLVGAPQAPDVLPGAPGRAFVVFGKGDGTPISLADVLPGGGPGYAMIGQPGDHVGYSTAALSDLDGDGIPEVAVGSETAAGGAGRAYVARGHASAVTVSLASVMNELGGYGLEGAGTEVALGRAVAGTGDFDGDGLAELVVAAPGPALVGDAVVHVLSGANASSLVLGVPPPGQGTTLQALAYGDDLGWSVASLPDWNGDGLADLALGAPSAGGDFGPGAVYVVFGRPDMSTLDLAEVAEGRGGFVVTGEDWDDDFGWRTAAAGDVDGDGSSDLLLGAPQAEPLGSFSGRGYVVLGVHPSVPELGACVPE